MEASSLDLLWVGTRRPPSVHGLTFHTQKNAGGPVQAIALDDAVLVDENPIQNAGVTPVIGFAAPDNRSDPRVELWVDPSDPAAGKSVIEYVSKVWRRLSANLCQASAQSSHLAVLAYAYSRRMELVPVLDPRRPEVVTYPGLSRFIDNTGILFDLYNAGLLTRRKTDELPVCPHCDGSRTLAREICDRCGRATLTKSSIVHHYRCGYQGPEADFASDDGGAMSCPKCQYRLRDPGRDHDQSGFLFICRTCSSSMYEPEVGFRCLDCGANTRGDEIRFQSVWQYAVSSNAAIALALLKDGDADSFLELLRGEKDTNHALARSTKLLNEGNKTSVVYRIDVALRDDGEPADLANAYDAVFSLLNRAMSSTDIISIEMDAATDGILVTTLGDAGNHDAAMRRIEARIAEHLENDDLPIVVSVQEVSRDLVRERVLNPPLESGAGNAG